MAAGLGFKTFTTGEVLTAGDVNGYLMQGINVFASSAARAAAITSPQEGQYSFLKDTNALEYYDGAAWVGAPVGDITAVTAGTGISGGGSSGDVTITNSMATAITTAGDLIYGTGSGTFTRRGIGSTGNVLTVSGGVPTWAAPAGGGKVLQVIYSATTTAVSVATSGTPQATGISGTITPSATSSRILIMANQSYYNYGANRGWSGAIYRNTSTQVFYQDDGNGNGSSNINAEARGIVQIQYVDSPSSTSALTYTIAARTGSGNGVVYQGGSTPSNIILIEIGA
jgi:hypothetical protein